MGTRQAPCAGHVHAARHSAAPRKWQSKPSRPHTPNAMRGRLNPTTRVARADLDEGANRFEATAPATPVKRQCFPRLRASSPSKHSRTTHERGGPRRHDGLSTLNMWHAPFDGRRRQTTHAARLVALTKSDEPHAPANRARCPNPTRLERRTSPMTQQLERLTVNTEMNRPARGDVEVKARAEPPSAWPQPHDSRVGGHAHRTSTTTLRHLGNNFAKP